MAAPYRPAHLAMLPLIARSPQELVAANVAGGVVEGAAMLVGPALTGGIRVLRADRGVALVVGCFVTQLFVRGVLNVLLVIASFDLLGLGAGGVGLLAAAMGAGAMVGAAATAGLAGRRRFGAPFAIGLVLRGAPLALGAVTGNPDAFGATARVIDEYSSEGPSPALP